MGKSHGTSRQAGYVSIKYVHPSDEDRHVSSPIPPQSPRTMDNDGFELHAQEIFVDWMNKYMNEWFLIIKSRIMSLFGATHFDGGIHTLEGQGQWVRVHTLSLWTSLAKCFILWKSVSLRLYTEGTVDAYGQRHAHTASAFMLMGVVRFQWKGNRSFSLCVKAL